MATDESYELQDDDQTLELNSLSGVVSNWNSSVSGLNLGSINIQGDFSPLLDNGIAVDFINGLSDAIRSTEDSLRSLSDSISYLIEEHAATDNQGKNQAKNITPFAGVGGNSGGEFKANEYVIDGVGIDEDVFEEFESSFKELEDYEHLTLLNTLREFSNDNLDELLYSDDFDFISRFQKELQNINDIPEKLKKALLKLEPQQAQVVLREFITNGSNISDFSKYVYENFDGDKSVANIKNVSSNFLKIYSKLSFDNIQSDLKEIYNGNVSEDVSDETISITRKLIDHLSEEKGVSYETILTDRSYVRDLQKQTSDLIKTFSYIDTTCCMGDNAIGNLISRLRLVNN